jgi:type I restriction enzyme S subunit
MGVKPGFHQTDAGVIPKDWDAKPIGNDIDLLAGFPFPSQGYTKSGIRLLRGSNVKRGETDWTDDNTQYWPELSNDITRFQLKVSDLVIAMDGSLVGRSFAQLQANDLPALLLQRVARIRSTKKIDAGYLTAFIGSDRWIKYADSVKTVTAIPHISPTDIRNFVIPIPPTLEEQHVIATALSDADAHISSLEQVIAKKRNLKQAAMQELLTGKRRLPGFSGEWDLNHLGEVLIRVTNGAVYKPTNSFGLPITRIETISYGTISFDHVGYAEPTPELQNYKLERGDILFSHINSLDHIGKVAIFGGEPELYHGMNLLLLRAGESITPEFLFYWLGSHQGRKKSKSLAKQAVSQASINTNELKGIELQLPPLSEQRAIATVLSDMDTELAALEQQRDKTKAIKQGMMQELLTGRIRLV